MPLFIFIFKVLRGILMMPSCFSKKSRPNIAFSVSMDAMWKQKLILTSCTMKFV